MFKGCGFVAETLTATSIYRFKLNKYHGRWKETQLSPALGTELLARCLSVQHVGLSQMTIERLPWT